MARGRPTLGVMAILGRPLHVLFIAGAHTCSGSLRRLDASSGSQQLPQMLDAMEANRIRELDNGEATRTFGQYCPPIPT